jgi:hypothetical protein
LVFGGFNMSAGQNPPNFFVVVRRKRHDFYPECN